MLFFVIPLTLSKPMVQSLTLSMLVLCIGTFSKAIEITPIQNPINFVRSQLFKESAHIYDTLEIQYSILYVYIMNLASSAEHHIRNNTEKIGIFFAN